MSCPNQKTKIGPAEFISRLVSQYGIPHDVKLPMPNLEAIPPADEDDPLVRLLRERAKALQAKVI